MQKTLEQILKTTARFTCEGLAYSYAGRTHKACGVILGDDGQYWVTTLANCSRLARMGYEWAK